MERGGVLTAKNSVTLPLRSHFIKQKKGGAERGACSGPGLQVEPEQEVRLSQLSIQRIPCKSITCKKKSRVQRFVTAPLEQDEGKRQDTTLLVLLLIGMWPGDSNDSVDA